MGDADGAFVGYDDPKCTYNDGWDVMCDDDGVVIGCDDPKRASNDGWGVIGEGKPPNYEPCSMITFVNDAAAWRAYK